jgi:peptidoglycan hydrolase-like protein with peptidoglycan-binding domain
VETSRSKVRLTAALVWIAVAAAGLAGCAGGPSDVERAQARVDAQQKAVAQAETVLASSSREFCTASKDYITALDRYGDVLHSTAPTVGDVRAAGKDLASPRDAAFTSADDAVAAQQALVTAQQDLAAAQADLADAQAVAAGTTAPAPAETPSPTMTSLAPPASVDRVKQAEADFAAAQKAVTDDTPLKTASVQFNSAVVALEMSWLKLFADAGCISDAQQQQAVAAVSAYTAALQQDLAAAGYYTGAVDGVYGPLTVQAVQNLQKDAGLPVTGTVDKATAVALQADLAAKGGAAAQASVASTAALQQTLKLAGYWDGPIDGVWTPALTEALKAFQTALGVEPTGTVDAATVSAFEKAIANLTQPGPSPSPTATASPSPSATP